MNRRHTLTRCILPQLLGAVAIDRVGFPKDLRTAFEILRTDTRKKEVKIVTAYGNKEATSIANATQLPHPCLHPRHGNGARSQGRRRQTRARCFSSCLITGDTVAITGGRSSIMDNALALDRDTAEKAGLSRREIPEGAVEEMRALSQGAAFHTTRTKKEARFAPGLMI